MPSSFFLYFYRNGATVVWSCWARRGLLALSLIFAASLAYVLVTRTDVVSSRTPDVSGQLLEGQGGIADFTFTQSREGLLQWEVHAARAQVYESEHRAVLDDVHVTLYGQQGPELTLAGDHGTIDTRTRDFVLSNEQAPLAVELKGGYTVYTANIGWRDKQREVHTDAPVTIVGDGIQVTGRGLVGKLDAGEFHVRHDVEVRITS